MEPGRGIAGEAVRMTAAGGWRCAGGDGGGGWCIDNQSMFLHRFRCGERRRVWLFLHRCNIAPAAAVDREPEAVRLEGGGMVPGGEAGGMAGGAIPPSRLRGLGRYVGLVSINFFLSFGSPRSAVLADSDCVSCCVCVDTEYVDK